jgi:hypothetical protein
MRLLAEIGVRLGVLDDAEFLLESAVEFAPDNGQVHRLHRILRKRQKFEKALEQAKPCISATQQPGLRLPSRHRADADRRLRGRARLV